MKDEAIAVVQATGSGACGAAIEDGPGGLLAIFGSGAVGGFLVLLALTGSPHRCCGETRSARDVRARCQALGVTPAELAALERTP